MGLVTFETNSLPQRRGIKIGDTVVDLSLVTDTETDLRSTLGELTSFESTARETVTGADSGVTLHDIADVRLHQPIDPGKIIRLEGCYEHDLTDEGFDPFLEADGLTEREWPTHIAVPPSATVAPGDTAVVPQFAETVRPGAVLAFVVGQHEKYLSSSDALDSIAGFLVAADIALYDDLPGLFGYKSFDGALPLGSEVVPLADDAVTDINIEMAINGETVDSQSTANWRFDPGELVASVSELMTLEPGDLILTGNPMRTDRRLEDGDTLTVRIDAVGTEEWQVERESTTVGMRI